MGNHDGAVPVNSHERPGQRSGNDWPVDEARVRVVAEVERRQVGEVNDQDELSPAEVGAHEQHDKGEVQEVVEDEVRSDAGGGVDIVAIAREKVSDIADLEDEENDPE